MGRRSPRQPTPLNLKAEGSGGVTAQKPSARALSPAARHLQALPTSSTKPVMEVMEPLAESASKGKNLNCLFMYNGHDWDAYQVLGVAAGSPLPLVTEAYQDMIKKADPSSYEFLESAYKAILKSSQGYRL